MQNIGYSPDGYSIVKMSDKEWMAIGKLKELLDENEGRFCDLLNTVSSVLKDPPDHNTFVLHVDRKVRIEIS